MDGSIFKYITYVGTYWLRLVVVFVTTLPVGLFQRFFVYLVFVVFGIVTMTCVFS